MESAQDSWKSSPVWAEWGRSLVREYPDGLGDEPDFSKDGDARIVWSIKGFIQRQKAMWEVGEFNSYKIGDRTYTEYPQNSVEDQIYIASASFKLAGAYWYFAKVEADEQAEKERQRAIAIKKQEDEMDLLSGQVAAADTMAELEIKAGQLRERLRTSESDEAIYLHRQLSIVQDRFIAIERKNTRTAIRWGWAGFIVGVVGILVGVAFPVWDLMHRPQEPSHETPQTTTSSPTASPGNEKLPR